MMDNTLKSILAARPTDDVVHDSHGEKILAASFFNAVPTGGPAVGGDADEKIIGLYFSANWCPPCHQFLPRLRQTYLAIRRARRDFEIIFVSWDNAEDQYRELTAKMPWLRVPYGDARCEALTKAYNVTSIPTLILVRAKDGHVITRDARWSVVSDPAGENFPWPGGSSNVSSPLITRGTALIVAVCSLVLLGIFFFTRP